MRNELIVDINIINIKKALFRATKIFMKLTFFLICSVLCTVRTLEFFGFLTAGAGSGATRGWIRVACHWLESF